MKYWLFKTEPNTYSWDDLLKSKKKITHWEGVRNYQARNFMRDEVKKGDLVFFYHSVVKPTAIVGIAKVVKEAYPDHFAWDKKNPYYDAKSSKENPRWVMVDIQAVCEVSPPITLAEVKENKKLQDMKLVQKGTRLSVQPVLKKEWNEIMKMREIKLPKK